MARIKPTKTDAKKLYDLLEAEDKTLEEVALSVLEKAFEMYEAKAKYTVVGQVTYSDGTYLDPSDPASSKVSLGLYPSESQAKAAVRSLAYSAATGEQAKVWVLPNYWGSPADWYKERKADAGVEAQHRKEVEERMRRDERRRELASRDDVCGEEFTGPRGETGFCMLEPKHEFGHWEPNVTMFAKCDTVMVDSFFNTHNCALREGHEGKHYNPMAEEWME